jgi:hypothetical protein
VEKWALFASLVPDPTWDQLQAVRESFPEIRAVLTDNRHLQRLLDWVELRTGSERAESADGRSLELDPVLVDELILRFRTIESVLPREERLEPRCRRLLSTQLGATEPEDPLMREFWLLKRMRHQLAIDPDNAAALLGPLIAGPWHDEAIEAVKSELDRDQIVRTLPRATRDGLALAANVAGHRQRIQDLFRLPPAIVAGVAGFVMLLGSIAGILLSRFPVAAETLLSARYSFEGWLPRDYTIVPVSLLIAQTQKSLAEAQQNEIERAEAEKGLLKVEKNLITAKERLYFIETQLKREQQESVNPGVQNGAKMLGNLLGLVTAQGAFERELKDYQYLRDEP